MAPAGTFRHLTVRAGQSRVTLDAETVTEVIRVPRVTRVPHGPPALLGVMHVRGAVLPVVSLFRLLGGAGAADVGRVVVLRGTPGIGVAVDAVETLSVANASHGPADDAASHGFDLETALREQFSGFQRARGAPGAHIGKRSVRSAAESLAFLGFRLAGQDYALPLEAIAEVIGVPATLNAVPGTESVLLGLMDMRGAVLPVVSLRALLGLSERVPTPADKVLVVCLHGQLVGLLVDQISVILRAEPDAVSPAPSLFNRGGGEARIVSVLRLPDARGLVSILTPECVFADARVVHLLSETIDRKDEDMAPRLAGEIATAAREHFLVIRLGEEIYGLPLAAVDEVTRFPASLTRLPRAPDYVQGLMSLRGKVIPVIDQRRRFSVEGEAEKRARRIVVVTLGTLQAGFAVDAVSQILEVNASDLMPAPELSDDGGRLFDRVAPLDGGSGGDVVLLMDPQALLARAEADLIRDLTAQSRERVTAPSPSSRTS